jgi:DNA helicase-2/ATP-dependent DNA helicase PcrA
LMDGIGPAIARRCFDQVQDGQRIGRGFDTLADIEAPAAAAGSWPDFCTMMRDLSRPGADWQGQLEQVVAWYRPLLEAAHDDAGVRAADLDMLIALAPRFGSRERFLTELTLDPPSASGDLAGEPLRDEDYLILSTVHSSKGQEWDSVSVLNVTDGNFPNEFSAGSEQGLEEERRLLYVAMTRAKNRLDLIEPQNFYVTQQPKFGDRHVRAARSRFLTGALRRVLQTVSPTDRQVGAGAGDRRTAGADKPKVDVASRMRGMW